MLTAGAIKLAVLEQPTGLIEHTRALEAAERHNQYVVAEFDKNFGMHDTQQAAEFRRILSEAMDTTPIVAAREAQRAKALSMMEMILGECARLNFRYENPAAEAYVEPLQCGAKPTQCAKPLRNWDDLIDFKRVGLAKLARLDPAASEEFLSRVDRARAWFAQVIAEVEAQNRANLELVRTRAKADGIEGLKAFASKHRLCTRVDFIQTVCKPSGRLGYDSGIAISVTRPYSEAVLRSFAYLASPASPAS